jgi:hypothetical protein
MTDNIMIVSVAVWLACGIFSAMVAGRKGRNPLGWLVLNCLGGIFALLAIIGMPALPPKPEPEPLVPMTKAERAADDMAGFAIAVGVTLVALTLLTVILLSAR